MKALLVAAIHVAIVSSLGAKLLVDRATRPTVWARTAPVDPDLPIRGRYVRLRVEVLPPVGAPTQYWVTDGRLALAARDGNLVAVQADRRTRLTARLVERDGRSVAILNQPLAFFIPEHVADPSVRAPGEELWVEVTIPRAGPPRPVRLGVKKDGVLTPLELR